MKFKHLIESLLNEATPDEIYKRYYEDIDPNTFVKLISYDPQTVFENRKIVRIGKYAKMIINMFRLKNLKWEDMDLIKDYLTLIYHHKIPVNVNEIKTIPDLYELVKTYEIKDKRSLDAILTALPKDSYKVALNTDKWIIYQPLKEISACYLGVNAQWCTTWGKHSLDPKNKDKQNRFMYYGEGVNFGKLYIIINKEDETDKYQFHFEKKEFMNSDNRPINSGEFLSENPEIKYFFFPSLSEGNSDFPSGEELARIGALSATDASELVTSSLSNDDMKNPLISAIAQENVELLNQLIVDEVMDGDIEFGSGTIIFDMDNYGNGELMGTERVLSWYNGNAQNSASNLYDEMVEDSDHFEEGYAFDFFREYFAKNYETLKLELRVINYEQLERLYYEDFKTDENLFYNFADKASDLSAANYQAAYTDMAEDIERYVDFGYRGTISVSIGEFIKFLLQQDYKTIQNNLIEVLDEYVEFCGIYTEYEYAEFDYVYPTYEQMEDKIDDYFNKVIESYSAGEECPELRRKLFDIMDHFKFNDDHEYSNERVSVEIDLKSFDCEDQTIHMTYRNKETGKLEDGSVKIDNLANYLNNYSLFENYIKFKKIIK